MDNSGSAQSECHSQYPKWLMWVIAVSALVFLIAIAYPARFYFLNDDFIHIPIAASGSFSKGALLRPVSDLTLYLDYVISGKDADGYHFTNLLIHIANSALVFFFCRKKLGAVSATTIAVVFLVYAFHSESVFWVIGRGGLLAGLFMLISLNLYSTSRSNTSLVFALIAFLAGLFSYETIWTLPALMAVLESCASQENRKTFKWTIWFTCIFFIYLICRLVFHGTFLNDYNAGPLIQFNPVRLGYNYTTGLFRLFLPPLINGRLFLALSVLVVMLFAILLIYSWKKKKVIYRRAGRPFVLLGISLIPVAALGVSTHTTESERILYVSSIFSSWLIVEIGRTVFAQRLWRLILFGLLVAYHAFFLAKSGRHHERAGEIVRVSLNCLKKTASADTLIAYRLPTVYEGNFLLRKGFPEAVQWLLPEKFKVVEIVSQSSAGKDYMPECAVSDDQSRPAMHRSITWTADGHVRIE
jgi:hypothetical protein